MSMMRWQPLPELISLRQAMEKLFENSFVTPSRTLGTLGPGVATPIDMYQTANEVVVKATLPGIKPEEVDITITDDTFSRSVTLPSGLNTDKAEADFDNGILTLTIPKSEEAKPRQIKVKAKGVIESKK